LSHATACRSSTGESTNSTSATFVVLSVGTLVVAFALLNAIGRAAGQILALSLKLVKVFAAVGFTGVLILVAVVLAVVAVAAQ
jgi:hypothetical protein